MSSSASAPARSEAVIEVADDGPGLRPEAAERVFERFYRVDESRSRDSGGAGLGLAIVAAIVSAHGGVVATRPGDQGTGAIFTVSLPLAPTPVAEAAPAPVASPA